MHSYKNLWSNGGLGRGGGCCSGLGGVGGGVDRRSGGSVDGAGLVTQSHW